MNCQLCMWNWNQILFLFFNFLLTSISSPGEHREEQEAGQLGDGDDVVQQEDIQQGVVPVDKVSALCPDGFFYKEGINKENAYLYNLGSHQERAI